MASNKISLHAWFRQEHVYIYIIDCYVGLELAREQTGVKRRMFVWQDIEGTKKGNIDAFLIHLGNHFQRCFTKSDTSFIHELLRYLGEPVLQPTHRAKPHPHGPTAGRFRQPAPDSWVIQQATQ